MRYGVKDYVLKPVDPDTFHTTIGKVKAELQSIRSKKQKEEKGKNFLLQYFLQTYLYSGNEEVLKKAGEILDESNWEQWHCAILIESDKAFFDNVPDNIDEELMQGLHRNFFLPETEYQTVCAVFFRCVLRLSAGCQAFI